MTDYKKYIDVVADFPKDGIFFKDISRLLADDEIFKGAIGDMGRLVKNPNYWIGIDARGFIFGGILAHRTRCPLVLCRKAGKLPGSTVSQEFELEYGMATMEIQKDSINRGDRVIIIDDLMATGGTMQAAIDMIYELHATPIAIACAMDLSFLGGSASIKKQGIPFYAATEYQS